MSLLETVSMPVLETERFDLRPVRLSDRGLIEHYASDERVARMTSSIPHPLPPTAAEAFVTRVTAPESDEHVWALDATRQGGAELMGLVTLTRLDADQSEVSYWVAPAFWNTGIASDAVQALVDANPLGNATMFAITFQDNPASARVLTHAGFEYIGDAETYSVARAAKIPTWTYLRKLR
ncbi:GNAT family N-acetyltransferase [Tropicibacter alexandrii]|uniref:GNAT family N-acetyltransferase n=1 Tax=Tropicibacter alexandrii TaxID=2267683 RepID=UPI000EF50401|nr:GNAT family N-acetyltransferase [Tropicibacter alexandrii]